MHLTRRRSSSGAYRQRLQEAAALQDASSRAKFHMPSFAAANRSPSKQPASSLATALTDGARGNLTSTTTTARTTPPLQSRFSWTNSSLDVNEYGTFAATMLRTPESASTFNSHLSPSKNTPSSSSPPRPPMNPYAYPTTPSNDLVQRAARMMQASPSSTYSSPSKSGKLGSNPGLSPSKSSVSSSLDSPYSVQNASFVSGDDEEPHAKEHFLGWKGFSSSSKFRIANKNASPLKSHGNSPLSPKSNQRPSLRRKTSPKPLDLSSTKKSSPSGQADGDNTIIIQDSTSSSSPTTKSTLRTPFTASDFLQQSHFEDSDEEILSPTTAATSASPSAGLNRRFHNVFASSKRLVQSTKDLAHLPLVSSSGNSTRNRSTSNSSAKSFEWAPFMTSSARNSKADDSDSLSSSIGRVHSREASASIMDNCSRKLSFGATYERKRSVSDGDAHARYMAEATIASIDPRFLSLGLSDDSRNTSYSSSDAGSRLGSGFTLNGTECRTQPSSVTSSPSSQVVEIIQRPHDAFATAPMEGYSFFAKNTASIPRPPQSLKPPSTNFDPLLPPAIRAATVTPPPVPSRAHESRAVKRPVPISPEKLPPAPTKMSAPVVDPSNLVDTYAALCKPARPRRPSEALRQSAQERIAMQKRRSRKRPTAAPRLVSGSATTRGRTVSPPLRSPRELPPRKRLPSKDLPPIPSASYAESFLESDDMDVDEEMPSVKEVPEEGEVIDFTAIAEEEEDKSSSSIEDESREMKELASRLIAPTSRQARFAPLLQGLRRLSSIPKDKHTVDESGMSIELIVGGTSLNTTAFILCGTEESPQSGRFANYIRENLNKSRWLSAACEQKTPSSRLEVSPSSSFLAVDKEGPSKRRGSTLLSPGAAIVQSYLERQDDADQDQSMEDAGPSWSDSDTCDTFAPQLQGRVTRSRARQLRQEQEQQKEMQASLPSTPPRRRPSSNVRLSMQVALDRPSEIYPVLLQALETRALPPSLQAPTRAQQSPGSTSTDSVDSRQVSMLLANEARAQVLFALRDEAVYLGYAGLVALVDAETTKMFS